MSATDLDALRDEVNGHLGIATDDPRLRRADPAYLSRAIDFYHRARTDPVLVEVPPQRPVRWGDPAAACRSEGQQPVHRCGTSVQAYMNDAHRTRTWAPGRTTISPALRPSP